MYSVPCYQSSLFALSTVSLIACNIFYVPCHILYLLRAFTVSFNHFQQLPVGHRHQYRVKTLSYFSSLNFIASRILYTLQLLRQISTGVLNSFTKVIVFVPYYYGSYYIFLILSLIYIKSIVELFIFLPSYLRSSVVSSPSLFRLST